MSVRKLISGATQGLLRVCVLLILATLIFSFPACNRNNGGAVRFASTTNPGSNEGTNNIATTSASMERRLMIPTRFATW